MIYLYKKGKMTGTDNSSVVAMGRRRELAAKGEGTF